MALNLRTAVAAISPITADIAKDIPLSSVALGVLGALPPIAFALSGVFAPLLARRLGIDRSLLVATTAMVVGHVIRVVAPNYFALLLGSIIVLAGMGFGNILLPPAVKRYFPDRVGLVTTLYVSLVSISTAVPALIAAPVGDAAGWRVALGVWAVFALTGVIPWWLEVLRHRESRRNARTAVDDRAIATEAPPVMPGVWRSPVAWAMGLTFGVSALNAYAIFAWLPELLIDTAGVGRVEAGAMLALYAFMGLPAALIIPILAIRIKNAGILIYAGVAFFAVGYSGMLIAPAAAPWLWVALIGLGPLLFPVVLTLINLRTRSHQVSASLSGFSQGVGYGFGALGPLVIGVIHDLSGGWTVPLLVMCAVSLVGVATGLALQRPRFVEDDLARHQG